MSGHRRDDGRISGWRLQVKYSAAGDVHGRTPWIIISAAAIGEHQSHADAGHLGLRFYRELAAIKYIGSWIQRNYCIFDVDSAGVIKYQGSG